MNQLLIVGLTGRMGTAIRANAADFGFNVVGGVGDGSSDVPLLGPDEVHLRPDWLQQVEAIIDFSGAQGFGPAAELAADLQVPFVSGSTGVADQELAKLDDLAANQAVLYGANMSLGVNLLTALLPMVSAALNDYDTEIVDIHHNKKKDAPSGTALALADAIDRGRAGLKRVYGREGLTGERDPSELAIHALRAGDVVGDHTVYFCGLGERIEITHRAHSRDTFARGALQAARFLMDKPAGRYSMNHVLGLEEQ